MDCKFGETEVNVNKCVDAMKKAAREGCSSSSSRNAPLSGYCFDSLEEVAWPPFPLTALTWFRIAAAELGDLRRGRLYGKPGRQVLQQCRLHQPR